VYEPLQLTRVQSQRWRRHEDELQLLQDELPRQKMQVEASRGEAKSLQRRAEVAEAALAKLRDENETLQKALAKADSDRRAQSRPHSPLLGGMFERPSLASRTSFPLAIRTSSVGGFAAETPLSQGLPPFDPPIDDGSVSLNDSASQADRVSTPQPAALDILSVSTAAAGPSIQLVERMSAGIRRLEAEKVATREELARISSQRDEARAEMVTLMKEVEASRTASMRVADLENEVAGLYGRYQTTLEMLGEKSEQVEELQADIEDVKAMYRDLVERALK
jgi:TATA element modulatory factor